MKNLFRNRLFLGLFIGLISSVIAMSISSFNLVKKVELSTLDMRYKLRPTIETHDDIGFIDFDDSSLALCGEWPWPRYRHLALVKTLDFYDALAMGYDVFFVERELNTFFFEKLESLFKENGKDGKGPPPDLIDQVFRNYDLELTEAIKKASNVYLAYFTEESGKSITNDISNLKREAMDEIKKSFLALPHNIGKQIGSVNDIDPPLPEFIKASEGLGFAQPGYDFDSVVRNYILYRKFQDFMLYTITLKMLSQISDFDLKDIEIHRGEKIVIRESVVNKSGERRDIVIPVDNRLQMLLNWAGPFKETFLHVPFRTVSYYYAYNTAKEIARDGLNSRPKDFMKLKTDIHEALTIEKMVMPEEAERISMEISSALFITSLLKEGKDEEYIFDFMERCGTGDFTKEVLSVVVTSLKAEKLLSVNPSLRYDEFLEKHDGGGLTGKKRSQEIFRNISVFMKKGRLDEIKPYYFPPPGRIMNDGRPVSFSPLDFEGKIFMAGLTATGTIDMRPTPFEESCPMVAYHVNALNTILTEQFLHYPTEGLKYPVTIILSLFTGAIAGSVALLNSFVIFLIITGSYIFAVFTIWVHKAYWIEVVTPLSGIFLTYAFTIIVNFMRIYKEKRVVRGLFSSMVSPSVLKVMEENPNLFSLTGERKAVTTFFSSLSGLEKIADTVSPGEMTTLLNKYLVPCSEIIMEYDGYIDKYEGNVIMADFGVPVNNSDNPWKCAFASIEQSLDFAVFRRFFAVAFGFDIIQSMGFNFGYVSAGNMGSKRRFQYTVMGDPVNTAARFMAANYIYNSFYPITGEDTFGEIGEYVYLRRLDKVLLKGKTTPTLIADVIGWKPDAYLKLCGKRGTPDFLLALWKDAPPEKILGYHDFWLEKAQTTMSPMAMEIRDFFEKLVEPVVDIFVNLRKRDILLFREVLGGLPQGKRTLLLSNIEASDNWIAGDMGGNNIENIDHESPEATEAVMYGNKITALNALICSKQIKHERLTEGLRDIREFDPNRMNTSLKELNKAIDEGADNYRARVDSFFKSIKRRSEEYHEMMSVVGAPAESELKAKRLFEEGLDLYWKRQWERAAEKFNTAAEMTENKGPAMSLLERTGLYKNNPPGEGWQGEFIQVKK